ncbi:hypothetical protein DB346_02695 [Verrucomicrobia bacterium LW23]|nr:hypothetical protein DB346_03960 [Verrucomicrobia bacterium LW23]PTY04357.1 hypothetical protein DB346_02695 [Verrucomicrobia bacterium LW23]
MNTGTEHKANADCIHDCEPHLKLPAIFPLVRPDDALLNRVTMGWVLLYWPISLSLDIAARHSADVPSPALLIGSVLWVVLLTFVSVVAAIQFYRRFGDNDQPLTLRVQTYTNRCFVSIFVVFFILMLAKVAGVLSLPSVGWILIESSVFGFTLTFVLTGSNVAEPEAWRFEPLLAALIPVSMMACGMTLLQAGDFSFSARLAAMQTCTIVALAAALVLYIRKALRINGMGGGGCGGGGALSIPTSAAPQPAP